MKRKVFRKKINTVHYGGKWIAAGLLVGIVIPGILYLCTHVFYWQIALIGGLILAAFLVVFGLEMRQDFGKVPYYQKHLKEEIPFDPEKQVAILKSSICTGETVAGFKNKEDGHFVEAMLIRSDEDLKRFGKIYRVDTESLPREF